MLDSCNGSTLGEPVQQLVAGHAIEDVVVRGDGHFGVADVLTGEFGRQAGHERANVVAVFQHRLHRPVDLEEVIEIPERKELFRRCAVGGHPGFRVAPGKGDDGVDSC